MTLPTADKLCLAAGLWIGLAACATTDRPSGDGDQPRPTRANYAAVIGRCVAAEDGRPLPNCEIYLDVAVTNAQVDYENWHTAFAFQEVHRFDLEDEKDPTPPEIDAENDRNWVRPYHLDRHFLGK